MPTGLTARADTRARLVLALIAIGLGCTRANPAYLGPADGGSASGGSGGAADAGQGGAKADASADTPADRRPDTATDTKADAKTDANADSGFVCLVAADCTAHFGAPVCPAGAWECRTGTCAVNCPNCTDADGDGFGIGTGCAGLDCDDTDPTVHGTDVRNCPTGAAGAVILGTCRAGSQSCTNGVWSTCAGQVLPSGEACNNEDDNCNGTADDGLPAFTCGQGACQNTVPSCSAGVLGVCVPHPATAGSDTTCDGIDDDCDGQIDQDCPTVIADCVHVSPDGNDTSVDGRVTAPFQTIQAALAFAVTGASTPKTICVAGGPTCQDRTSYTLGDATTLFQMSDGVSIYGNYESTGWTRCVLSATAPDPTVTLELRENGGIRFPPTISQPTALDGFVLERNTSGASTATIAAVTVNGAKQVRLSNLIVNDTPNGARTYGVNLLNGGEALITHCQLFGGAGTTETYGVHSVSSKPTIRENCSTFDNTTGHCIADCASAPGLAIGLVNTGAADASAAVLLDKSPGASVETSTICSAQGPQAIGVHIIGDATGTVIRGAFISASAGTTSSLGILIEDCNNAEPWIVGNELIEGQGALRAAGIVAMGTCQPVIDGNKQITGGGDTTTTEADGVSCETNAAGEASLCAVLGNESIQGSSNANPTLTAGVACKDHGCVRVASNVVVGNGGTDVIGVWLQNDGTMVEQNQISGGCGAQSTVGILADDAFARVQNNLVTNGTCTTTAPLNIGVRVYTANDLNEIDIDSNTIDGGGNADLCASTAIEYGVGTNTPPTAPKGIVRNNILRGGACLTARTDLAEVRATSDPRVFENNDLVPSDGLPATTLYLDEATTAKNTAAAVNALTDISSHNNISANPAFVAFPSNLHLGTNSACSGAGTATGAPATDFDGKTRSKMTPSIGAYE